MFDQISNEISCLALLAVIGITAFLYYLPY